MQFQISWNLCCYFVVLTVGQWMVTKDNNKYISSQHPFFWLTHEHLKQVKQWCMRMEWSTPWAWFVYGNSNMNAFIMQCIFYIKFFYIYVRFFLSMLFFWNPQPVLLIPTENISQIYEWSLPYSDWQKFLTIMHSYICISSNIIF